MNYVVPFIENTKDDTHCLQAAYLMIAKFFDKNFDIDWEKWSELTGYEENKGTWAIAGLLWFNENGYDVLHISLFDYQNFMENGGAYLIKEFGQEIGQWQIEHSNIPLEQQRTKKMLDEDILIAKEPTTEDIKTYLANGYLVRCLVNSNKLNGQPGYAGHAVVISGYDNYSFFVQDPGLPAYKDRKVLFEDFESAWAYPNKEAKELDAIKLK